MTSTTHTDQGVIHVTKRVQSTVTNTNPHCFAPDVSPPIKPPFPSLLLSISSRDVYFHPSGPAVHLLPPCVPFPGPPPRPHGPSTAPVGLSRLLQGPLWSVRGHGRLGHVSGHAAGERGGVGGNGQQSMSVIKSHLD